LASLDFKFCGMSKAIEIKRKEGRHSVDSVVFLAKRPRLSYTDSNERQPCFRMLQRRSFLTVQDKASSYNLAAGDFGTGHPTTDHDEHSDLVPALHQGG
jgi:hypothetical protein